MVSSCYVFAAGEKEADGVVTLTVRDYKYGEGDIYKSGLQLAQ